MAKLCPIGFALALKIKAVTPIKEAISAKGACSPKKKALRRIAEMEVNQSVHSVFVK
ncbi:Uncharacterised protein [Streptococcus equi subsp. equi]|nr:Uncharacterised protein [Streptococcus equi subsp. equi]